MSYDDDKPFSYYDTLCLCKCTSGYVTVATQCIYKLQ